MDRRCQILDVPKPARNRGPAPAPSRASRGQEERERASPAGIRLHRDPSPVILHDPFADREADPRARKFLPSVEALEDREDAVQVGPLDPDSIVAHMEQDPVLLLLESDMDAGRVLAPELDRVADEVLEQKGQLKLVTRDGGEGIMRDDGTALLERQPQVVERGPQVGFTVRLSDDPPRLRAPGL